VTRPPRFDDVLGGDVPPEERDRLRRVHKLLVEAGPPPELTPMLADPPTSKPAHEELAFLPRRRVGALLSLAAALALIAFLGGYLAGKREGFSTTYKVQMHSTAAAPGASGLIKVGQLDKAGNWPLLVTVRHLKPLAPGGYYEMYVTRNGKRIGTCGTFRITSQANEVRLNAPYKLGRGVGWIVTARPSGTRASAESVVLTT
jgi:hypothetical protein